MESTSIKSPLPTIKISTEDLVHRAYVDNIGSFVKLYIYPVIFIFGMVGNILMFMLMSQKEFRKTSVSVFMRGLAVTDSMYLIGRVLQIFIFELKPSLLDYGPNLRPICMEYIFALTFSQAGSLLILMCMTFERAFCIMFPYKTLPFKPRIRAFLMTLFVIFLALIWALPFVFTRKFIPKYRDLGWSCPFTWSDDIAVYVHHFESACGYTSIGLLVLANCFILHAVISVKKRRENVTESSNNRAHQPKDDIHFLYMLIIVSFTYVIPYLLPRMKNIYYLNYPALTSREKSTSTLLSHITVTIENCNFACNFYLYALPVTKFRRVLVKMLTRIMCSKRGELNIEQIENRDRTVLETQVCSEHELW